MVAFCILLGAGTLCSWSCPYRPAHHVPINLWQVKWLFSVLQLFISIWMGKYYTLKVRAWDSGCPVIFQALGNILVAKAMEGKVKDRSHTESDLFFLIKELMISNCGAGEDFLTVPWQSNFFLQSHQGSRWNRISNEVLRECDDAGPCSTLPLGIKVLIGCKKILRAYSSCLKMVGVKIARNEFGGWMCWVERNRRDVVCNADSCLRD